jgi:hypothetical protein
VGALGTESCGFFRPPALAFEFEQMTVVYDAIDFYWHVTGDRKDDKS